jgi:hypothetical protein
VEVVGSSGCCNRLRRARRREGILSLKVVGSFVAACIAFVVVTAAIVVERLLRMS